MLQCVVAFVLCLAACASGAQTNNLVGNPGFEAGLAGWSTGHAWYANPRGSGVSAVALDESASHTGRCSLRIDGKANRGIAIASLRIVPGKYRVAGWVRTSGLGSAQAHVLAEWMDGAGKWISGQPTPAVSGDTGWTFVEAEVEAPPSARSVNLDLLTTAANDGAAWFDDISLERVPPPSGPPPALACTVTSPAGGSGELQVAWTPVEGAVEYRVTCRPDADAAGPGRPSVVAGYGASGARVAGLANGRRYRVSVVAVTLEGRLSAAGPAAAATPRDRRPPRLANVRVVPLAAGRADAPAALLTWTVDARDRDLAAFAVRAGSRIAARPGIGARQALLRRLPPGTRELELTAADRSGNSARYVARISGFPRTAEGGSAGLAGTVRKGGQPAGGARVEVRQAGRTAAAVRADAQGRYRVARLPAGVYVVQAVTATGIASAPVMALMGGGAVSAELDLSHTVECEAWAVPPTEQVLRAAGPPERPRRSIELTAMAGQTRTAQVVVRPRADVRLQGVRFEPLAGPRDAPPLDPGMLSYRFVAYYPLKRNSTALPPEELVARAPGDFPDELTDAPEVDVKANQAQPIVLLVSVPRGTQAGLYRGRAYVRAGASELPFELSVNVAPVEMPARMRLLCVNWLDWGAIARKHSVPAWSEAYFDALKPYTAMMREHHQNVVLIPGDLCAITVEPGGDVTYDWTLFDRAVRFFISEGLGERICLGHLGGRTTGEWECPTFTLADRPASFRATGQPTTVPLEAYLAALDAHLGDRGWPDRVLQHVADEPLPGNTASWREQSARVRKAAPRLKRIDAIQTPDLKGALEVWVPQINFFNQWYDGYRAFQKAGDAELWFYIAWVPQGKYPQRLIDTPAIKARIIHWMNYLWGTTGYLHWALQWWDIDVESLAPGDSRIIWPGKDGPNSSLRYEAQREGLEDCETLAMLEDAYRDAARRLGVRDFDARSRPLELGHGIVRSFIDYTRSYVEIEAVRLQILQEQAQLRAGPALLTRVSRGAHRAAQPGPVEVEGWTEPGATVTVNGRAVSVRDGRFQAVVEVSAGAPEIVVRAARGDKAMTVTRRYRVTD